MDTSNNNHVTRHVTRPMEPVTESFGDGRHQIEEITDQNDESTNQVEPKLTRSNLLVVSCIIITEFCERMTFYSVVANMVLFCTLRFDFTGSQAAMVTLVFSGTVYITPLVGGIISDEWLGKFKTIVIACLIYIIGLVLLLISSIYNCELVTNSQFHPSLEGQKDLYFTGLAFISLGTGGIKANIGPFGAQQIEHLGSSAIQTYFNWYYWFINAGSIIAFTAIAYLQQNNQFEYSFIVILAVMVLALVIFSMGYKWYLHRPPEGSICGLLIRMFVSTATGYSTLSLQNDDTGSDELGTSLNRRETSTDRGMDAAKAIIRVFPILALTILYWAVYSQMNSTFFLQSVRLDISVGQIQLPAASLAAFNTVFVMMLIPIMDRIVYPCLNRHRRNPSTIQRIGFGIVLSILATIYSGIIEIVRKNDIKDHGFIQQNVSMVTYNASKISIFVQIPEFALIGTSEVFTSISGLEFSYTEVPSSTKGLMMGLYFLIGGLGSYLSSLIVLIVSAWRKGDSSDWFPDEPNNGHLEYMLFLLAGLTSLSLWCYIALAIWYKRKVSRINQSTENDESVTR